MLRLTGTDLTLASLAAAARDPSLAVDVSAEAMARVDRVRTWLDGQLAREPLPAIYGITTGFGEFKRVTITRDWLIDLQQNIVRSHAAGVGENADADDPSNYFGPEVVRAALIIRVNTFLRGHSAVTTNLVTYVVGMINAGIVPLVPTRGSLGSSGDLCPLCHTFLPLLGEGAFYVAGRAAAGGRAAGRRLGRGEVVHAGRDLHGVMLDELRARGMGALAEAVDRARNAQVDEWKRRHPSAASSASVPIFPVLEKEGLALSNGATYSAAMLALACVDAEKIAAAADTAAAMTMQAIRGRTHALLDEVHAARGFAGQRESAARMRSLLRGSTLVDTHEDVQDCYSVRCAPQVHGASRDAITHAASAARAEINAACDNPLFFPTEDGTGYRVVSAGNFHGQPLALAADFLAIGLAELANISERRTQMLLDHNHNRGLPSNLIARGGLESGLMLAQYAAASLVSENKVLCHPASVDSIPSSSNVEDHVAMATHGARKMRTVLGNTAKVLAIEFMTSTLAAEWRVFLGEEAPRGGGGAEGTSLEAADARARAFASFVGTARERVAGALGGCADAYRAVRRAVDPLTHDRVLSGDILAVSELVVGGELSK
jgi:histidine ammonia-lyase